MANRPNERTDENTERRADAQRAPLADRGDIKPTKSKPSVRWVQLAYDLEQYGDPDPDERREVY